MENQCVEIQCVEIQSAIVDRAQELEHINKARSYSKVPHSINLVTFDNFLEAEASQIRPAMERLPKDCLADTRIIDLSSHTGRDPCPLSHKDWKGNK